MTKERKTFALQCGAFAPSLRAQLRSQGFRMKRGYGKRLPDFQTALRMISRFRVRSLLTRAEAAKAESRLYREISACIEPSE